MTDNPLLGPWDTPFGLPPFDAIRDEHFRPAYDAALDEARANYAAIAADPAPATFENTVGAMERAERTLGRVSRVFGNLSSADSTDEREAIDRDMAPVLANFGSEITMNRDLYARLKAVPTDGLGPEEARVLHLYKRMFERAGAGLDGAARERMVAINERLATLHTEFDQNVLAEEKAWVRPLSEAELTGLPPFLVDGLAAAAKDRDLTGHVLPLARSLVAPFLRFCPDRALREEVWRAWTARGQQGGAHDNRAITKEILALRHEAARIMGHETYAHEKLATEMAREPGAVHRLLREVWPRAVAKAVVDAEALTDRLHADGVNAALAPWDWAYYAEAQRRALHDFDESTVKPYLTLDSMIAAAFDVAKRLFDLDFTPIDVPLYHPDARAWDVTRGGRHVALFIGDYYARPSKRQGAWMWHFRPQHKLDGGESAVILNVCNFAKADPCLLSMDDARTLFHEFGHALHGMLSNVTWPFISGTSVAGDFVELPSQLYEHWLEEPAVLAAHARHHETGEPMPDDLRRRLLAASKFDKAAETVGYTASALVDMALHDRAPDGRDTDAREAATLAEIGMPDALAPFHRAAHFRHIFAGSGYAAGYYSYLWSEVMDADAFEAFREAGDVFDRDTARRLEEHILSAGGSAEAGELYERFRGRLPGPEAMLKDRGLLDEAA